MFYDKQVFIRVWPARLLSLRCSFCVISREIYIILKNINLQPSSQQVKQSFADDF